MFKKLFGGSKSTQTEAETETLKSLRKNIEGYIGYDNVKDRMQTDKAIRNFWYERILELLTSYSQVQNKLMQGQLLSTWPASNEIMNMLNEMKTLLVSDVYRHSTFFETQNVSESLDISVIYLLESETILQLRDIEEMIKKVNDKLDSLELLDVEQQIYDIKNEIQAVKTTISDRAELIASFELVGI